MDGLRKKEIREKAEKITHESEKFQLIHATYAARSMIKGMVMDLGKFYCRSADSVTGNVPKTTS